MILVDANVVIDFWRNPRAAVEAVLAGPDVYVCGVTLAELMQGAMNQQDCERIEQEIGGFLGLSVSEEDWATLGQNLFRLRIAGVRVPFQDVLLATVAINHGMDLWTLDSHYALIRNVLPDLKLFEAP